MDWKDKLKQVKELFPKEPIEKTVVKGAKGIQRNNQSLQKDIALSEEVLEKRMTSKISFVCREFKVTKEKLADVLYLGNYHLNINNEEARITPGMYLYLSKNLRPEYYELNKDRIAKILDNYVASSSKKQQKETKNTNNTLAGKTNIKRKRNKKKASVSVIREPYVSNPAPPTTPVLAFTNNINIAAESQTVKTVFVDFEDILFDDQAIRIKNGRHISTPCYVKESRKSLFLLKRYFKKLKLAPIEVVLQGNNIKQVKNIDQLNEGIEYLNVIKYYFDNNNKIEPISAEKLIKKLEKISNSSIKRVASLDSIEGYFDHLNDLQLADYKIVPVIEVINTGQQIISEDTYLYTIATKSRGPILIIWESSIHGRATYAFLSNKNEYLETIQSIFDFISSNRRAKRSTLRKNDPDNLEMIDCVGRIKHQSFEHWKMKLGNYIDEY